MNTSLPKVLLPSYPKSAPSYGFLVWLNQPAGEAECCGPRWECPLGNDGSLPTGSRILDGGGEPQGAPTVLGLVRKRPSCTPRPLGASGLQHRNCDAEAAL